MVEKRIVKPRTCWICKEQIVTDADGIKEHYKSCKKEVVKDDN